MLKELIISPEANRADLLESSEQAWSSFVELIPTHPLARAAVRFAAEWGDRAHGLGNRPPHEASTPPFQRVVRYMAIACGFVGVAFYCYCCAWMIELLVEMSPVLTIGSALVVGGSIVFSLRAGRRSIAAA